MVIQQKQYNIKELCEIVIKEIHKQLSEKYNKTNFNIKNKNHLICEWINKHYEHIYQSYLKEHPLQ